MKSFCSSSRRATGGARMMSKKFSAITICCFLSAVSGQQLNHYQSGGTNTLEQVGGPSLATNTKPVGQLPRIGTAPHDRQACQLPALTHHQRRHQVNSDAAAAAGSPMLSDLETSSGILANQTTTTSTTRSSTRSTAPRLSQPTFVSLASTGQTGSVDLNSDSPVARSKRFDSSERLRQLRQLLASNSYDAYLVTPNDEHGSEYTSEYDRRLRFISGFTGSNGYALILLDRAVLFTDGRYALQADQELDCNWWLVVNDPLVDLPLWLKENAANGLKIATDARLMSLQSYDYLEEHLRRQDSEFALISQDLIDVIWNSNAATGEAPRLRPEDPLFVHPLQFTGNVTWQEKLVRLADSMNKLQARHYIVSQLDDLAWLLNLRGNDIPSMPLFKAYALVSRLPVADSSNPVRAANQVSSVEQLLGSGGAQRQPMATLQSPQVLQVQPSQSLKLILYVDLKKVSQQVRDHLHVDNGTTIVHHHPHSDSPVGPHPQPLMTTRIQVELRDYEVFIMDIRDKLQPAANGAKGQLQGRLLLNANANVAIHVLAKGYEDRMVLAEGLIMKLKAVKTDGEVQGMRLAHWRDSLAISMLLSQLDHDIGHLNQTNKWSEVSAAKELEFYRSLMDHNKGESFPSISAYGSNAAIVHYSPDHSDENPRLIGNQSTYLLDCGGQYLDGTTDITRTVHYGEPSEFQRETYTRVLMGAIDMMSLIFDHQSRQSVYRLNDLIARRYLFEIGLDYAHGTGHGIGLYSMVHEAPWLLENYATGTNAKTQTSKSSSQSVVHSDPIALQANMFTSVEPGYYKANEFGIRLENIVVTQRQPPVNRPASNNDKQERQFLRFEPLSLVPFEPKLIKTELLSNKQKAWLNSYNLMVRHRMTKQINHYLEKILSTQSAVQVKGSASSSRLYQQLMQVQKSTTSIALPLPPTNRTDLNFLRLDGSVFKEKLERTHRWILSKTELIPLDVPQALMAAMNPSSIQQQQQQPKRDHGDHSTDIDLRRLMLHYMASLPFNNPEASEAVAALGTNAPLGGRMGSTTPEIGDSSSAHLAAGNKCSGFECDLWLLSSLNRASSYSNGGNNNNRVREQRQRPAMSSTWPAGGLTDGETDGDSADERLTSGGNIWDLFQLNGSRSSSYTSWPINMWSMVVLGLLIVLQLAIVSFMCRRQKSTRGSGTIHCQAPVAT